MTSASDESAGSEDLGITDDQLPEDLQPEENPLAEGLDPGESAGDLLEDGKSAEQNPDDSADSDDSDDSEDEKTDGDGDGSSD